MKQPDTPSFEVNFGRASEGDDMETLATYVMHGLVQGEVSRYERIRRSMDRLQLPDGADDFRIGRRLEADAAQDYSVVLRAVADSGLVADLVEPAMAVETEAAEAVEAKPAITSAAASTDESAPLFPVESVFQPAGVIPAG